jgi:hypothetical protein
MANNTVSSESGYPSSYDYNSMGPEETAKMMITTPAGMTQTAPSARVNPHQNDTETKQVGMTGSTYTPSRDDKIILSEGGHLIIMGNAAGNETMRLQSKHGAMVEMDSDGRFLINGPKGLHASVGGDNQMVVSGDVHLVAGGDYRIKCSDFVVDCHNFKVHTSGNHITDVYGSHNLSVTGDSHTTVQGDASTAVGGSTAHTTAGDMRLQAAGDMSYSAKGTASFGAVGAVSVSTKDKLNVTSTGDATYNSKAKTNINSTGDLTTVTAGKMTHASAGDGVVSAKGKLTLAGTGVDLGGSGALKMAASTVDVQSGANKASPDWVAGGSASAPSAADAKVEVANVVIVVPDDKQILDNVGDMMATQNGMDKIYSSEQLDHAFNTEEGGKIPDKVMARAKAIGAIDANYKAPQSDGSGEAVGGIASPGSTFGTEV